VTTGSLLDLILLPGSLRAEFQPVLETNVGGTPIHYFEGLVRGPLGTNVEQPEVLFGYARRKHAEAEVDRVALRTVLCHAAALPAGSVAVNIHASTLATDLDFLPFLSDVLVESGLTPERLVLELVEHGHTWDWTALKLNLEGLRHIGVRLALDDFGTGQANYLMLMECRPDYLKVDRHFVHGCHADERRQAFLESLASLGGRIGARVVAEGVEVAADLAQVRSAGIALAQGHLLGRPGPAENWRTRS
jgi:EAL domain-containing protein (putative c-di-GMP-specific phosphodiesterase class I)